MLQFILLQWNFGDLTAACLGELAKVRYDNYYIVVVDNGSMGGSAEYIQDHFPEVHLIRNPTNAGYCAGCNIGIRATGLCSGG